MNCHYAWSKGAAGSFNTTVNENAGLNYYARHQLSVVIGTRETFRSFSMTSKY